MKGIPLTEQEHAENVAMWKRFEPTIDKEKKRRKSPAKKEKHDRKNSVRKNDKNLVANA